MDWYQVFVEIIESLVVSLGFFLGMWALGYRFVKRRDKYRFTCDICHFVASSNNLEVLTRIRSTHTHHPVRYEERSPWD